ncbi:MAG: helix-turn-helix transcriptional regulator [Oscillospiraceae bacterium]|nr:helix-turn-helix transcriptional regulator [Oscillospiraceae bacterium]
MEFAENLRTLRKERHFSQEELAELLDVSRQAVSKWEQGSGYPETEKLVALSRVLDCSLDDLMGTGFAGRREPSRAAGTILITSPHENKVISCSNVSASGKMAGGKDAPHYVLFSVDREDHPYWGRANTFLGWYADEASIAAEVEAIRQALVKGTASYTLQYSVKTESRWMRRRIIR